MSFTPMRWWQIFRQIFSLFFYIVSDRRKLNETQAWQEITLDIQNSIIIYKYNEIVRIMRKSCAKSNRTKHINVRYRSIRDSINQKSISLQYYQNKTFKSRKITKVHKFTAIMWLGEGSLNKSNHISIAYNNQIYFL